MLDCTNWGQTRVKILENDSKILVLFWQGNRKWNKPEEVSWSP